MKLKALCAAMAAALGTGAAHEAGALPLNQFNAADTTSVYTMGSTALDNVVLAYMRFVCNPGSLDVFSSTVNQNGIFTQPGQNVYTTSAVGQNMFFCTLNPARVSAALASKKILLRKSQGDSGEGVSAGTGTIQPNMLADPAVSGTNVSNYTCVTAAVVGTATNQISYQPWTCGTNVSFGTQTPVNAIGFSDVEYGLLANVLVPKVNPSGNNVAPGPVSIAAQVFGIPVTKVFRNNLQNAQGFTVGSDNEDQMPSLSRGTVTAILTGNVTDVTQFTNNAGTAITAIAGATAPSHTNMYLVRRPDSSGTMMSTRSMYDSEFCAANVATVATDNTAGTCGFTFASGIALVTQLQSTGSLLTCLGTLNTLGGANGVWAVGMASTTNNPFVNPTNGVDNGWRWAKIDGATPSLINAATGRYNLFTEAVISFSSALGGTAGAMALELSQQLAQPTVLNAIDTAPGTQQSYSSSPAGGWNGGVAVPGVNAGSFTPPAAITAANLLATPVLPFSRAVNGPNTCQPPQFAAGSINIQSQAK